MQLLVDDLGHDDASSDRRAEELLGRFNMKFGIEKTQQEPISVLNAFEFLGIEFCNGLLRPC